MIKRRKFNKYLLFGLAIQSSPYAFIFKEKKTPSSKQIPPFMRKPKRLQAGDTIGLIAPSSSFQDYKYKRAVGNLESLGFKIKFGKNLHAKKGYLAGTDEQRLEDLHQMFADKSVDGIWCLRGGYGATRILSKIDYSLIKKNPKVFIGYSDITALLQAIYLKTGLICFHGPVGSSSFTDYTLKYLKATLMEPQENLTINNHSETTSGEELAYQTKVIRPGIATGEIVGGNLSLLSAMAGTKFSIKAKNKIVFIEDIGERPYRIDRMLTQMIEGTDLRKAAGIIFGICVDCARKENSDSQTLNEVLQDRLYDLGMPVITGMSFGHIDNQFTLPIGIKAKMDTATASLTFLEQAVI